MPKQYTAIRDAFTAKGMDYDEAQTRAAKIYNSRHPGHSMRPDKKKQHKAMVRAKVMEQLHGEAD